MSVWSAKQRWRGIFFAAGAAALLACGEDAAAPRASPGSLDVRLQSPNGAEGAALVELDGTLTSVSGVTGTLHQAERDEITKVLILLEEAGEIRFRVTVPDVGSPPSYRVIEVSGPDDTLRSDLSGYGLEFMR